MKRYRTISKLLRGVALAMLAFVASTAQAFPTDTYAENSVLASGRWVKVSVTESGMHFIPAATLRSWGFRDVNKVRIHGYGGQRINDVLSLANYVDDLPQVQSHATPAGVYFYAKGPVTWTANSAGRQMHTTNPFSDFGFYYVTENDSELREIPQEGNGEVRANAVKTYVERVLHEQDLSALSESGHLLVGEDFRHSPSRTFEFDFKDLDPNVNVWMRCAFVTNTNSTTEITFTANGEPVQPTAANRISAARDNYGMRSLFSRTFPLSDEKLKFTINYIGSGVVSAANLDFLEFNYTRKLRLLNHKAEFEVTSAAVCLGEADEWVTVWDVTDPYNIRQMNTAASEGNLFWVNNKTGRRRYAAWNENASLPAPKYVGLVANQNIHGVAEVPDMVIFTLADWAGEAERLANFHRTNDGLNVLVLDQELVFNEFSSGTRDVNSFRRLLKMFYDRGKGTDQTLKYALMMGRPIFDNRVITSGAQSLKQKFMPTWQTDESLVETGTFTTDDIFAFLEDNSGSRMTSDVYSIAVGRIPARTLQQAKEYVTKVINYVTKSEASDWKNHILTISDDGDDCVHMNQAESMTSIMTEVSNGGAIHEKIYVDAYDKVGGVSVIGRERMYRALNEGVLWWTYIGHASKDFIGGENLLLKSDIENLFLRRLPVIHTSTCSFAEWDGLQPCGAEALLFHNRGGVIAAIGSARKSYISQNGFYTDAIARHVFERDENGNFLTVGEIVRRAKNDLSSPGGKSDDNKVLYVFMGDPAMKITMPSARVILERINDQDVTPDGDISIMARQRVKMEGAVYDGLGENVLSDFNGMLSVTLYDAEYSTTTKGVNNPALTYEEQGTRLYTGRAQVVNGKFTLEFSLPSEISDNYRPASINMHAVSDDNKSEAIGANRDFYVYGYDESADPDTEAPVIEMAYLNHESFTQGSTVNESPMFIAHVSDDTGINMSTAGVGHQMTIKIDDRRSYNDVSFYYTASADGSPSGTVAYPLSELAEGNHRLTFRVWDTSGNSATHTLDFFVQNGAKAKIFDVYTDASPAQTEANFYVSHNRPEATMTVTFSVYNMKGQRVWTSTVTDRSDMFLSAPVTWNLCDQGGQRVPRGIYLYRATINYDGNEITSQAKRIAVTGR